MDIRVAMPADLGAVDAVLSRSYPRLLKADYSPSVLVTALPLISRAQPALLASGTYYIAQIDGLVVGAGGWTPDAARPARGHMRHLVTDDRFLRRGVGQGLVQASVDAAGRAGIAVLECWSTRTAERFYAAQGFVRLGLMEVALRPGITFPAIRMERSLTGQRRRGAL